jgi:ribonuclease Y
VQKLEKDVETRQQRSDSLREAYEVRQAEVAAMRAQLQKALESVAGVEARALAQTMQENMVESRRRESLKSLRHYEEEVDSNSKRLATRTMARAMARYSPEFYWPKSVNFVEIAEPKLVEKLAAEGQTILADMKEKAECEVELLVGEGFQAPIIKLAGGAGVNREAARLALTDLLTKGEGSWGKAGATYDRFRAQIEQEAVVLGRKAIREVQLEGIHPEIQKLVGYLNWRTSYRQNQWYHTVEVAKLAGILAHEVGCDPDQAKRVGLLHDIGKALDYKIDGSHAVISGDYADRFGERRLICDTVMSHHNDLLIETPLAYVLRAADTLSGARPGARVNLEEGYQTRLSGIEGAVRSFPGIIGISIMNGGREVHVEVNHKRIQDNELESLSQAIARKIEAEVAFPGEIKILVSRRFEATAVA